MIELLEARIAPAAVVTYTDIDGDKVTVKTSKGTEAELRSILIVSDRAPKAEVRQINFAAKADIFAGTSLTITVERGPNGDGQAHVGFINATGMDLGKIKIAGDVGQIHVGSSVNSAPAFKSLTVASLGRFGLSTQGGTGDLTSEIVGDTGKITVRTDLTGVTLQSTGYLPAVQVSGSLKDSTISAGLGFGNISISRGAFNSVIESPSTEASGKLQIGGSFLRGKISAGGNVKLISIAGDLVGGLTAGTGSIEVTGDVGKVQVGGSVIGNDVRDTGEISVGGDIRTVIIKGSLKGGNTSIGNESSGAIIAGGDLGKVVIKGDVISDSPNNSRGRSGHIIAEGRIGSVEIGGDIMILRANSGDSVQNGPAIRAGKDIGRVTIAGDVRGSVAFGLSPLKSIFITAYGEENPSPGRNLAIGKVTVGGSAVGLIVAAGFGITDSVFGFGDPAANPDAQIGTVSVQGNWSSSSIIAGVDTNGYEVGDAGNTMYPGGLQATVSSIAKIIISGTVLSDASFSGVSYGFVAEHIGTISIAGAKMKLNPLGAAKDVLPLGRTPDRLTLREV